MSPIDDVGGLDGHAAFLALHRHAGNVPEDTMGISNASVEQALTALLADDDVPASAHLELLHGLADQGFPDYEAAEDQYRELAGRIASAADTSVDQVLDDAKAHATGDQHFLDSTTGQQLPHEVTAFFGEDICHTFRVDVDGKSAVWLFSEFETDAPFKTVAEWVNPENWPERSPMVFKSMKPTDGVVQKLPAPAAGGEAWHADFLEIVQLAKTLKTDLHLDYAKADGLFAGCSYELVHSHGDEIDVDRGFLLVNELGDTRNVKCLKVVGFTDDYWDDQTLMWACLSWTHFLKSAVRGGSQSEPADPQRPHGDYTLSDVAADWYRCVSDAGKKYADKSLDWLEQVGPGYSLDDAVSDTASLWISIAQDWANATAEVYANMRRLSAKTGAVAPGSDMFSRFFNPGTMPQEAAAGAQVAADGQQAAGETSYEAQLVAEGFTAGRPGYEGATIAWQGLQPGDTLKCSDMTRLGSSAVQVPAADVESWVVPIGDGWSGAHLEMPVGNLRPGLYIGDVTVDNKGSRAFQLYVSKATGGNDSG